MCTSQTNLNAFELKSDLIDSRVVSRTSQSVQHTHLPNCLPSDQLIEHLVDAVDSLYVSPPDAGVIIGGDLNHVDVNKL